MSYQPYQRIPSRWYRDRFDAARNSRVSPPDLHGEEDWEFVREVAPGDIPELLDSEGRFSGVIKMDDTVW